MSKAQLISKLRDILPLDDESLEQMISNAQKLPTHTAITEYWLGLLGESPDALDFIGLFIGGAGKEQKREPKPVKRSGKQMSAPVPKPVNQNNPWGQAPSRTPTPKTKTVKRESITTSQLLDKPEVKVPKMTEKRKKQQRVENIKELDEILRKLEVQSQDSTTCNCMATRHPLFEMAPNCLNCGKIICVKEGLKPCSFCGQDLISKEEKRQIVEYLEAEREQLTRQETPEPKASKPKGKKVTISMGAGVNLWKEQESLFDKLEKEKELELKKAKQKEKEMEEIKKQDQEHQFYQAQKEVDDPDLLRAKQNLENLLNFQANSAERTKIIDQASDFDLPTGSNINMWSSSVEKALQLKKQQRQLKKQEQKQKELSGRGKRVMDITIGKDGKAVIRQVASAAPDSDESDDDEEIQRLEQEAKKEKDSRDKQQQANVWDPEKYNKKFDKPVYLGEHGSEKGVKKTEFHWERVQQIMPATNDLEELVTLI